MSYIIQLNDGDMPTYWTDSAQYHPMGHWTDRESAMTFISEEVAEAYIENHLQHQQDMCKVVPK